MKQKRRRINYCHMAGTGMKTKDQSSKIVFYSLRLVSWLDFLGGGHWSLIGQVSLKLAI